MPRRKNTGDSGTPKKGGPTKCKTSKYITSAILFGIYFSYKYAQHVVITTPCSCIR